MSLVVVCALADLASALCRTCLHVSGTAPIVACNLDCRVDLTESKGVSLGLRLLTCMIDVFIHLFVHVLCAIWLTRGVFSGYSGSLLGINPHIFGWGFVFERGFFPLGFPLRRRP